MYSYSIDEVDIVVVDVETTGLDPLTGDRICEIGAIKWRGGEEIDQFHSLVNPERPIPYSAIEVHNITEDMVEDAPIAADILPAFCTFIEGTVLAAYNAKFDMGFLQSEMARTGAVMPSNPVIDVLKLARRLLTLQRYPLWNVARAMGITDRQAHRALQDVEMTGQIFQKFLSDLKAQGLTTVNDVMGVTNRRYR